MIVTITKDSENNKEYIQKAISSSNPNKDNKTGFWLFNEDIQKSSMYLDFDKYDLVYTISLDNNNKPVGMVCVSNNYEAITGKKETEGYAGLLCIQSLKKGEGDTLMKYIINKEKTLYNKKGIILTCYTKELVSFYNKYGFSLVNPDENIPNPKMIRTFDKSVNSSASIMENWHIDPTFGSDSVNCTSSLKNGGIVYKILPFIPTLQGNKNTEFNNDRYIHKGSRLQTVSKRGKEIIGRVYRIVKDELGYITNLLVFDEGSGRVIEADPEHFTLLENANSKQLPLTKKDIKIALISNAVKKNGPICFESKNSTDKIVFTLNEGVVKMFNITHDDNGNEYINNIVSIDELNEHIINKVEKEIYKTDNHINESSIDDTELY